ncbi:DNA-binding transcriptional regulator [Dongia mobilis]|jgi:putative transcriptional regulator|uniref:helix-turn-helix domain-containing protein n=1 Tax=Dongia sp. TaxID=1977262 RepID=UPI0026ED18E4
MTKGHKIVAGLREAIAYAKGGPAQVRVSQFNVPENIDVRELRERLGMSQSEFALRFGFSVGTLRQWEQGRRYPDGAARVLLTVIDRNPEAVTRALEEAPERKIESSQDRRSAVA